jgi:hypothetical protein
MRPQSKQAKESPNPLSHLKMEHHRNILRRIQEEKALAVVLNYQMRAKEKGKLLRTP